MESHLYTRDQQRKRRTMRIRKRLRGNGVKPRLSIFRSNKHLLAQLIDDEEGITLFGIGTMSKEFKGTETDKKGKAAARAIGAKIADAAKKHSIKEVIFDRGPYKYHGVIAELADAAREAGLRF